jgi:chromosome segregation ATPase
MIMNDSLRLQSLQVYNWGYTPFTRPLPIGDKLTVLYGANGSGKTTYLNAILVLLGIEHLPRGAGSFDRFVREGQDWAFVRATIDNRVNPKTRRRPFQGLFPAIDYDEYTLVCVLDKRSGSWKREYYISPGDSFAPEPDRIPHRDFIFTGKQYRELLERVGISQALLKMLNVGIDGVTSEMNDPRALFNFFFKLIGREDIRAQYNDARKQWLEHREEVDRLELQYQRQEKTIRELAEQVENQRKLRQLTQQIEQNKLLVAHAEAREIEQKLMNAYQQRTQLHESIESLKIELDEAEGMHHLAKERYQELQQEYTHWQQKRNNAEQSQSSAQIELTKFEREFELQSQYIENIELVSRDHPDDLEAYINDLRHRYDDMRDKLKRLQQEFEQLQIEYDTLQQGKIFLPPKVDTFIKKLRAENMPYIMIADVIDITDSKWAYAVEGILGIERFTIIIEDDHNLLRAKQMAERERYTYWISPPSTQAIRKLVPNSLWEVIELQDDRVAGYVGDLLMGVQKVNTVEAGHRLVNQVGGITITPEAYRQEKRGGRSLYSDQLVCGANRRINRLNELELLLPQQEAEIVSLAGQVKKSEVQIAQLQVLLDKLSTLPQAQQKLTELSDQVTQMTIQFKEEQAKYHALKHEEDQRNQERDFIVQELQSTSSVKDQLIIELDNLRNEISRLNIGRMENELETIQPTLPNLTEDQQRIFERDDFTSADYYKRISSDEESLEDIPVVEPPINEELFRQQQSDHQRLGQEITTAKQRQYEARELLEKARGDYEREVQHVFNQRMAHEFRNLCKSVKAQGSLDAQTGGGDFDDWSLEVRVGFNNKRINSLAQAYLSRGQSVLTSLFLVLAALRAIGAAPILILDELMSLLDEANAPLVLESLRSTEAQCFVATPQSRAGLENYADVLWGFQQKAEDKPDAPPVAVVVKAL